MIIVVCLDRREGAGLIPTNGDFYCRATDDRTDDRSIVVINFISFNVSVVHHWRLK